MRTNAEMELASAAILAYRAGEFKSIESACLANEADYNLAMEMIAVEDKPETKLREDRQSICVECMNNVNDTCMVCACPMQYLLYNDNAKCPEGLW